MTDSLSLGQPFLIAGPCVLESFDLALEVAEELAAATENSTSRWCSRVHTTKANRTAGGSFRGPGLDRGLTGWRGSRAGTGLPIITDIHEPSQASLVAEVADVLQIPAFLYRRPDYCSPPRSTGRIVNIKKGQFMAPWDMRGSVEKIRAAGFDRIWLTERGSTFGYNNLVVDFRSLVILKTWDALWCSMRRTRYSFLAGRAHPLADSVNLLPYLARAAAACGCSGIFSKFIRSGQSVVRW